MGDSHTNRYKNSLQDAPSGKSYLAGLLLTTNLVQGSQDHENQVVSVHQEPQPGQGDAGPRERLLSLFSRAAQEAFYSTGAHHSKPDAQTSRKSEGEDAVRWALREGNCRDLSPRGP